MTTGHRSSTPVASAMASLSSGVVFGVILSTMLLGKATCPSIQPASSSSRIRA